MMGWLYKDAAQKRAQGSQKLTKLIEAYYHEYHKRYAPDQLDDPAPAKQRAKIEAFLSDASAYDPNLAIESRLIGHSNLMLLLQRAGLGVLAPKLFEAGFDSTLPEHRALAGQMVPLQAPLQPAWDLMRKQGFDFSWLLEEEGSVSLMQHAITFKNKEAIMLLLEDGVDPIALPSRYMRLRGPFVGSIEIKPVDSLLFDILKCDRLVTLLMERGLITLEQIGETWSPSYFYTYNRERDLSMFSEHNVALAKVIYDRYAPSIQAYRQAPGHAPNPADGWQDKDMLALFGCGLLPQALDSALWQGLEARFYELYLNAPEHIQKVIQHTAPDLIHIAQVKTSHQIMVPAQHWGIGIGAAASAKETVR